MKKISRKRFEWLKQKHYEMYDWLSKNPESYPRDWLEKHGETYANHSFACQLVTEMVEKGVDKNFCLCQFCPMPHPEKTIRGEKVYGCMDNLFLYVVSPFGASPEVLQRIRDLPWDDEYVEDEED